MEDKKKDNTIKSKIIYNFEFLRVVLTTAIIVHHFYFRIRNVWTTGWVAVEFFFIIAGFVFSLNLNTQKQIVEYAVTKIIKFVPVTSLVAFIIALCGKFDIQRLFADIFLLPLTGLYDSFGYNGPAWFVAVLFWISLFTFALLKNFPPKYAKLIIAILTFWALTAPPPPNIPRELSLIRGFAPFGVGFLVGDFCKSFSRNQEKQKSIPLTILEAMGIIYFCWLAFSFYQISNTVAMIFQMAIVLMLLYFKKGYISSFLEKKYIMKISKYTMSVFLTHSLLYISVLEHYIKHYRDLITSHSKFFTGVGIITSWILGIIAYHIIQQPINNYCKRKRERERAYQTNEIFLFV